MKEAQRLHPRGYYNLASQVAAEHVHGDKNWPTPNKPATPAYKLGITKKPTHSVPTPTASDHIIRKSTNTGGPSKGELNHDTNKSVSLDRFVGANPEKTWPTPRASEYKDCGPVGSKSQKHMDDRSYLCARAKDPDRPAGCLSPDWVEWLMGVPTGWTSIVDEPAADPHEWKDTPKDGMWRTPAVQPAGIDIDRLETRDGGPPRKGERLYDKHTGRNAQYGLEQQVQFSEPQSWLYEPDIPRVVEDCPNRVDRIRLLGNGVVPQTAAKAWLVLSEELEQPIS